MRTLKLTLTVLALGIFTMSASMTSAEPMSLSGMQDIGELTSIAENTFDMEKQDAVILFNGEKNIWLPDGRLKTVRHEIVWIGTEQGIRSYADLRIPYDGDRTEMKDITVRTWREEQWWVSGPTGSVETLPFAVRNADDYTNMREMMLLHDGVELPCIMETIYTIEDKEPFRDGAEGLWYFQQDDPVVWSWFGLGLPKGNKPNVFTSEGISDPEETEAEEGAVDLYIFKMGPLDTMGRPRTSDPATYSPYIAWSTWKNWNALGKSVRGTFDAASTLDDALKDSLANVLIYAPIDVLKAKKIAEFVSDYTNHTHYSWRYWLENPRPAHRTYATAYGHSFDRTALAGALFKEAGLEVNPIFRSRTFTNVDDGIATLARFDDISLWISGDGLEAYYDPVSSILYNGLGQIFGRTIWIPGSGDDPVVRWSGKGENSSLSLRIKLEYDPEEENWTAKGLFTATGGLCPYEKMEGANSEASSHLNSIVSGVLSGAEVTGYNPIIFDRFKVTAGFEATIPQGNPDGFDRIRLEIGDPHGGLIDQLPHDVHLNEEKRLSPVLLPGNIKQSIRVCLEDSEDFNLLLPENKTIENEAGSFKLTVKKADKRVVITREISLNKTFYTAQEWSQLRALLLAERHERYRTVFVKQ